jgi:hypothetical protein
LPLALKGSPLLTLETGLSTRKGGALLAPPGCPLIE